MNSKIERNRIMRIKWTKLSRVSKQSFLIVALFLSACTTNAATGKRQFTGLMPASNEAAIGAQEHAKVEAQFGKFMTGPIADYVNYVGQKIAAHTERKDVKYRFYVLDTPMVNAFALPGGYTYYSRGLLTLANSEAELAAVIAHEIGHITGRHAAERMSKSAITGIGAAVIGATIGGAAGQVANLGSNLYVSSHSRTQEHESDELGVRYIARAGYDPMAMAQFLASLDAQSKLKSGGKSSGFNYFSTHPITADRVQQARQEATKYAANNHENRAAYLTKINGLTYGDSADAGFTKGNRFYHPKMDFTFSIPNGAKVSNQPTQVLTSHSNGTMIVFDAAKSNASPASYLANEWLKGKATSQIESTTINGQPAATTAFAGTVNNKSMVIRLTAVQYAPGKYYRFQMAIPKTASASFVNELKDMTYSLRKMTANEKASIKPKVLRVLVAPAGSTNNSMAARMNVDGDKLRYFLVLNGMLNGQTVQVGQPYKIVM